MYKSAILVAVGCLALFAGAAEATPITTAPPPLIALGGDVTAVYVYASAADTSKLILSSPMVVNPIFCNRAISGKCSANHAGNTYNLGSLSGPLVFTLRDRTTGRDYTSNAPDSYGDYHVKIGTSFSVFGVGPLPSAAATALAGLHDITFVGWEDHDMGNGSDFDYNDLIFAFSNTSAAPPPTAPEPLTLSLVGMGLIGAFGLRRRRKPS